MPESSPQQSSNTKKTTCPGKVGFDSVKTTVHFCWLKHSEYCASNKLKNQNTDILLENSQGYQHSVCKCIQYMVPLGICNRKKERSAHGMYQKSNQKIKIKKKTQKKPSTSIGLGPLIILQDIAGRCNWQLHSDADCSNPRVEFQLLQMSIFFNSFIYVFINASCIENHWGKVHAAY